MQDEDKKCKPRKLIVGAVLAAVLIIGIIFLGLALASNKNKIPGKKL
jgi:hypothetical protein